MTRRVQQTKVPRKVALRTVVWVCTLVAATIAVLLLQGSGVSSRRKALPLEERVAKRTWRFLIPPSARSAVNPAPATAEVLTSARKHWADHCATCHGNNGDGDTTIGRNVFPRSPDMRLERTQRLTDGELFYAIEQGIPFTAMPAWANLTPEGERLSWELVRFIRHLPALTAEDLKDMERFNPKSALDAEREREIEEFLKKGSASSKSYRMRPKPYGMP